MERSGITSFNFSAIGGGMTEAQFQSRLITDLKKMFPGCEIAKMDASYQQGFPDLLILWNDKWAVLEVKISADANVQPNQEYYINKFSSMSFGSYIFPENKKEVLSALQQAFESTG
jgi:hypothetical protein